MGRLATRKSVLEIRVRVGVVQLGSFTGDLYNTLRSDNSAIYVKSLSLSPCREHAVHLRSHEEVPSMWDLSPNPVVYLSVFRPNFAG